MNDTVERLAEETVNAARTAVTTLMDRYQRVVDDFGEVAAANERLQTVLNQERADASGVADELAQTNAMVHRYRELILSLARAVEDHPDVTLTEWQAEQVKAIREEAIRRVIAGRLSRLRTLMEDGPSAVTSVPPSETAVPLGVCPRCDEIVYSGQKFAMHRLSWGVDFAGDRPGAMLVFTHREHDGGDHSKDGV